MSQQACLMENAAGPGCVTPEPGLGELIGTLQSMAAEQGDAVVEQGYAELASKLASRELNLVVVGQFKRGKTSFLNALMGAPILPVAVLPLTSVVTVLRYGEQPRAAVHFEDGTSRPIGLERLAEFVTEPGNPANKKGVSRVEVFYPSTYLQNNVRLIDTPGIGSVYAHNTEAAYSFLPRIDAAIFVTSPDPPLTSAELEMLSSIAGETEKVFLVVNKTDLADDSQLREVIGFLQRNLPAAVAGATVLPVSSRLALEARQTENAALFHRSGLPALEAEIQRFLRFEKDEVFDRVIRRRLLGLISELRIRLILEAEAARTPVDELRRRLEELNGQLRIALRQEEDSELLIRGHLARLGSEIDASIKSFAAQQEEALREFLARRAAELSSLPRRRLAEQLDKDLRHEIESRFDAWLPGFEKEVLESLRQLTGRFQETINELIRTVRETAGALFGIDLRGFDPEVELVVVRSEGYYTDSLLGWGLGSVPLLLPRILYERYLRAELLRRAPVELERNANRRSYDLRRRLDQSAEIFCQALKQELEQTVARIRGAIQSAIALQASGEVEARAAVGRFGRAIGILEDMERALNAPAGDAPLPRRHRIEGLSHE